MQLVALAANALGNYVLMYGACGAPALGAVGAGWSSALVLWLSHHGFSYHPTAVGTMHPTLKRNLLVGWSV